MSINTRVIMARNAPTNNRLTICAGVAASLIIVTIISVYMSVSTGNSVVLARTYNQADVQPTVSPVATQHKVVVAPAVVSSVNASHALVRVSQLDPAQYASAGEANTWSEGACSAASMTEVINSYGHNYRITDILAQEIAVNAITPALGLLDEPGVARTMSRFGFTTDAGHQRSLDQIIAAANSGMPVIVSFPPPWGHILVLRGGDATNVQLADSSKLNITTYSRLNFLKHWQGFSAISQPAQYSVLRQPSLSADFINKVLVAYHSPAAGKGQILYDMGVKYGIDPAFALAFFMHESSFGTQGEARKSLSLGNLRCIQQEASCTDGYAWFNSWEDGFQAYYQLISGLYIAQWGLATVDQIIPKYAPTADNNNESAYIASLKHSIDTWHAGTVEV